MEHVRARRWVPVFVLCGSALLLGAAGDAYFGWLVGTAEAARGGPGLSPIAVRALWHLRVWCGVAGLWSIWVAVAHRRTWSGAPWTPPQAALTLYPAAIAASVALWTLPLGFVGDDFLWLAAWDRLGWGVLHREPGAPHYIPLGLLLCNVPHAVAGLQPLAYRIVTLLLHAATAALVTHAARASRLPPLHAVGAGVVFATTALAYEPVLWATGQFYLWPALLVAGVLIVVLRAPEDITPRLAWCAGLAAAAAGFIIEQAAGLTLFVAVWAFAGAGRTCSGRVRAPLLLLPLCGGLALMLLRAGTRGMSDAVLPAAQIARNVNHVIGGMLLANSPAGHMLGGWVGAYDALRWPAAGLGACGLALWAWRSGTQGRTLLAAWGVLWLPALLFAPQSSRYWYLPAIPAAIGLMRTVAAFEVWWGGTERRDHWPVSAGAIAAWTLLGALAMGLRVPDWRQAERLARRIETDLATAVHATPGTRRIVAAGIPDGIGTGLWPAYVFNNGAAEALVFRLRREGLAWEGAVELLPGPMRGWPAAYVAAGGPPIPAGALERAAREPDTLAGAYEASAQAMYWWRKP